MKIKTIRYQLNAVETFDAEVNAALADGWKLKKRYISDGHSNKSYYAHRMLIAELVRDEPTTVQSLEFEVSLNMDEAEKRLACLREQLEPFNLLDSEEEIKIKYFADNLEPIKIIRGGDWIDLRAAENVSMRYGEYRLIRLGVGMILPDGYEAHVVPRSSTFKNFGIIQANSFGVIDNSYSGDADEWHFPAIALRDNVVINAGERICQFRIMKNQPEITFTRVNELKRDSRGGIGSTGKS